MTKLIKGSVVALSFAALSGFSVMPVFAKTNVNVSGNGAKSENTVTVDSSCLSSVTQSGSTVAFVNVNSVASTGGNKASGNTGGDVTVTSGDAASMVAVTVTGGDNTATAPSCCSCLSGDTAVTVKDNGYDSENKVNDSTSQKNKVKQLSTVELMAGISSVGKTGKNKANGNTKGTVDVTTGASLSDVTVSVSGGSNVSNP